MGESNEETKTLKGTEDLLLKLKEENIGALPR